MRPFLLFLLLLWPDNCCAGAAAMGLRFGGQHAALMMVEPRDDVRSWPNSLHNNRCHSLSALLLQQAAVTTLRGGAGVTRAIGAVLKSLIQNPILVSCECCLSMNAYSF